MESRGRVAFKNISANFILQLVVIISGFIVPKLLITNYGSDSYGLVSSITQFLSLIALLEAGIGPVIKAKLYKYMAKNDKNKILLILKDADSFFKRIGLIFLIYIIILCIIFPYINNEFDFAFTTAMILVIAIGTLFEYFFGIVYNIYLQADKKYYVTSNVQIVCYVLNILLVVLLINLDASIITVKFASTLAFLIRPLFQSYYVRKKLNIHFKDAKGSYKIENKFDGLSQHIAYVIYSNTDVTVLTIFANLTTVAIYSVYNMVANSIRNVISSFINGMDSIFGDMFARGERESLKRSFDIYEFLYYFVSTVIFLTTMILIVPFVKIYTKGITDANYIQPLFAFLIILSGLIACARTIYSTLVYSIGHFKQTNMISWVEAITNILLSIILVVKLGLVGVAIGTAVSAFIRLVYFMFYSSKNVLNRSFKSCLKWLFVLILEVVLCYLFINSNFNIITPTNYLEWILYAVVVLLGVTIVTLFINIIFNFSQAKETLDFLKKKFGKDNS